MCAHFNEALMLRRVKLGATRMQSQIMLERELESHVRHLQDLLDVNKKKLNEISWQNIAALTRYALNEALTEDVLNRELKEKP